MPKQKRILILTESRGGKGHIMPATAITQALHNLYPHKHRVTLANMGDESDFFLEDFLHSFYLWVFKQIPWILWVYKISDTKLFMRTVNQIYYVLNKKDINRLYLRIKPNLVLSNYPIWDYAFYKALKKQYPDVPYLNLNTDSSYSHYAWLLADADYNIVADEDTKKLYINRGKNGSKIKVLGIPVRQDVVSLSKTVKLSKMPPKPKYKILVMPSSSSANSIIRLLKPFMARNDYELEVVMGRSKVAADKIRSKISSKNIKVIGWTDEIAQKLADAHIVISKAGGSTTQECIAMMKPMIINKIIPGQEEANASLIKKHRLGVIATKPSEVLKACDQIINDYPAFQKRIAKLAKPDSAKQIAILLDSTEA